MRPVYQHRHGLYPHRAHCPNRGHCACLAYYDKLGPEFSEQIRSMLVFDALIYNEDRHFGNFGVLRDNHSGNIIAPAPHF